MALKVPKELKFSILGSFQLSVSTPVSFLEVISMTDTNNLAVGMGEFCALFPFYFAVSNLL